ncbi:hypothetical protein ACQJBY_044618 [Aegilops geniculata]
MDVGRSGHGVVCSGRRRRWPGGGGGSGWRRPRGQGAGDVAAQGPVHLGCHGGNPYPSSTLLQSHDTLLPPVRLNPHIIHPNLSCSLNDVL